MILFLIKLKFKHRSKSASVCFFLGWGFFIGSVMYFIRATRLTTCRLVNTRSFICGRTLRDSDVVTSPADVKTNPETAPPESTSETVAAKFAESVKNKLITRDQKINEYTEYLLRLTIQPYLPTTVLPRVVADYFPRDGKASMPFLPVLHYVTQFHQANLDESFLAADGTDQEFNPGAPFTRRMWASGSFHWPKMNSMMIMDTLYHERTNIDSVQIKKRSNGEDMLLVSVKKKYYRGPSYDVIDTPDETDLRLTETRNWVFLPERTPEQIAASVVDKTAGKTPEELNLPKPEFSHTTKISRTALFRFSALTFNAHRIHLDPEYCRTVEGHPDLLVHGPLTMILLYEFLNYGLIKKGIPHAPRKSLSYVAMQRLIVEEEFTMHVNATEGVVWADKLNEDGTRGVIMKMNCSFYPRLTEEEMEEAKRLVCKTREWVSSRSAYRPRRIGFGDRNEISRPQWFDQVQPRIPTRKEQEFIRPEGGYKRRDNGQGQFDEF